MATYAISEVLVWLVICPVLFGVVVALGRLRIRRQDPARMGLPFSARDRHEVLDHVLGTAAFCLPMVASFVFATTNLDWSGWAWWSAIIALFVVASLPMQLHANWSARRRGALDAADTAPIKQPQV
jgi:hypothetical protein